MQSSNMLQAIHCLLKPQQDYSNFAWNQVSLQAPLIQTTIKLLSTALVLLSYMPKEQSLDVRLTAIMQQQHKLVNELKSATPARQLQIQAEIVSLTEEQSQLLQEAGQVNCFIFTSSSVRGSGWIEEERNYDGAVRQYRYGYYKEGKSKRRYIPKALVSDVQRMIASGAKPQAIMEFIEQSKTRDVRESLTVAAVKNYNS